MREALWTLRDFKVMYGRDSWRETQLRGRERFGWSTWSAVGLFGLTLPPALPNHPPPAHADFHPPAVLPAPRPSALAIPHLCVPLRSLPPAWRPIPPSALAPPLSWLAWVASPHHHAPGGREVDGALSRPSPKRNGAPNTCPDYCAFPGCSLSVREGSVRVVTPWNTRTPAPSPSLGSITSATTGSGQDS